MPRNKKWRSGRSAVDATAGPSTGSTSRKAPGARDSVLVERDHGWSDRAAVGNLQAAQKCAGVEVARLCFSTFAYEAAGWGARRRREDADSSRDGVLQSAFGGSVLCSQDSSLGASRADRPFAPGWQSFYPKRTGNRAPCSFLQPCEDFEEEEVSSKEGEGAFFLETEEAAQGTDTARKELLASLEATKECDAPFEEEVKEEPLKKSEEAEAEDTDYKTDGGERGFPSGSCESLFDQRRCGLFELVRCAFMNTPEDGRVSAVQALLLAHGVRVPEEKLAELLV